jgi:hypothetical protein
VRLQGTQGADLVGSHKPAIADDICRQDRSEPAFHRLPIGHRLAAVGPFQHALH